MGLGRFSLGLLLSAGGVASAMPAFAQSTAPIPDPDVRPSTAPPEAGAPVPTAPQAGTSLSAPTASETAPVSSQGVDVPTGDIVVTARKQTELLSRTPLAVSATSGADLKRLGVNTFDSLAQVAPNIVIDRGNGQTGVNIALRGVQDNKQGLAQTPGVAVILDGVQQLDPRALVTPFFDVDHIEVLRGPQGTLYGAASPGGVVNVVSNRPTFRREGLVDGEIGNFHTRRGDLVVNLPVTDTLAVRVAGNVNDRRGYLLQVGGVGAANVPDGGFKALNAEHDWGVRGSVLWQPAPDTSWLTSVTVQHSYDSAFSTVTYPTLVAHDGGAAQRSAPASPIAPDTDDWSTIAFSDFSTRLGGVAVQAIGGFSHVRYDDLIVDNGGIIPPGGPGWIFFPINGHTNTYVGEVRAHNADPSRFEWTVGGTYNELDARVVGFGGLLAAPCRNPDTGMPGPGGTDGASCLDGVAGPTNPAIDASPINTRSTSDVSRRNVAGYATLQYHVTDAFEVTAGGRLSFDRITQRAGTFRFVTNSTFAAFGQPGSTYYGDPCTYATIGSALCSGRADVQSPGFGDVGGSYGVVFTDQTYSAHKVTWKVGADYKPSATVLIYANISTGYKPGGFNPPSGVTTSPCCYSAENLIAYEVGFKGRIFEWLRLDSTAFYYEYNRQQVVSTIEIGNANFTSATVNTDTSSFGIENLLTISPTRRDRLTVGLNYLHAQFDDLMAGGNAGNPFVSFAGIALDKAPRFTATAQYSHTFDLGARGNLIVGANTSYTSEYFLNVISNAQRYRQSPFHRTGLDVTYTTANGRYSLQAFVKNIEDEVQETFYQGNPFQLGNGNVGISEPRLFGMRATARF